MKYILVIGDGMADHPLDTLGGRTPLEASKKDAIDALARHGILGSDNRSFINNLHYSVSDPAIAIVATNDGNVQYVFGLGQAGAATAVNVTGANAVLPNRPIMDVATDPLDPLVGYAAVGGFTANTPATPGQTDMWPFVIPVAMGLLQADGTPVAGSERVLVLDSAQQSWTFDALDAAPVASLLRGFSAPVILEWEASEAELFTLLGHDTDAFNRWEAGQRLAVARLLGAVRAGAPLVLDAAYLDAMRAVLRDAALDCAFKELVLTLPSEGYLAERLAEAGEPVDPQAIHAAREAMRAQLARELHEDWAALWDAHASTGGYRPDPVSCGRRALANLALANLVLDAVARGDTVWPGRALQRFKDAGNMTDRLGALAALVHGRSPLAAGALERFHAMFRGEALVIDKWFALQAAAPEHDGEVFARIRTLAKHPDYSLRNPNRARSLLMTMTALNPGAFHRADGSAYAFWAEKVREIDGFNPQLASRLARALDRWRALAEPYRTLARAAIEQVAAKPELSPDTREIVTRALAD